MDDNENLLDVNEFQKMNFSPFSTQFTGMPANAINQFTSAKFAQNLTTANGQVVGVVSGGDGGVHYLRPLDGSGGGSVTTFPGQVPPQNSQQSVNEQQHQQQQHQHQQNQPQALITLPITMPGAKPGDAQQTVHIQVINPNPVQQQPKFQMGQMQIPIQNFGTGGTTVLTVAYGPQDGKLLPNHGFPEGMTVVAALQPQDLQVIAQAQAQAQAQQLQQQLQQNVEQQLNGDMKQNNEQITVKTEPSDWDNNSSSLGQNPQADLSEFIATHTQPGSIPMNLTPYLKFNPNSIKYESHEYTSNTKFNGPSADDDDNVTTPTVITAESNEDGNNCPGTKPKRKRRTKKPKLPKQKPPKPGQVLIATAIDGTILFCCPECQMAYPEKENLEQHLTEHKIERRYICDICGAGLKRKEHLERHKSGHNPDRPYICSVCMKGFKRKEHLNLHFVIHSGEKNEICTECGKGFYRKDHLRKHTNSHIAKRIKEEKNARDGFTTNTSATPKTSKKSKAINNNNINTSNNNNTNLNNSSSTDNDMDTSAQQDSLSQQQQLQQTLQQQQNSDNSTINNNINVNIATNTASLSTNTQPAISLSTVYVPTSDNTTLPVQIQIPQIITTSCPDGTTRNTIVMPSSTNDSNLNNNSNSMMMTTRT